MQFLISVEHEFERLRIHDLNQLRALWELLLRKKMPSFLPPSLLFDRDTLLPRRAQPCNRRSAPFITAKKASKGRFRRRKDGKREQLTKPPREGAREGMRRPRATDC